MSQKPLKPHLIEINALKSMHMHLDEWLIMYKKLQQEESQYHSLYLDTESWQTRRFFKKKMNLISRRLDLLSKRISFDSLLEFYSRLEKRLSILYEFDKISQREESHG